MNKLILVTLLFIFSSLVQAQPDETPAKSDNGNPPIAVVSVEYPPFIAKNLPNYGEVFTLLSDYAQKHFKRAVTPNFLPPARAQAVLKSGKWCLSIIPPRGRTNFISLADADIILSLYRLAEESPFRWQSLDELKGKSVAMFRTLEHGEVGQQMLAAGINIIPLDSLNQGLGMLLKGRVDYWFSTKNAPQGLNASAEQIKKLQFSQVPVMTAKAGVFYNDSCKSALNIK